MKLLKAIALVLGVGGVLFLSGCGGDDPVPPTEAEEKLKELAGDGSLTWALASGTAVTLDNDDRTADWSNFELTFTTSKSYSTSNSTEETVWPVTGTWDFTGTEGSGLTKINRSDGVVVNIDNISESNMTLSFTISTAKAHQTGRVQSIEGDWAFKFVKK